MSRAVHFKVRGRVQGVMFRQTLIRAAQKRKLDGGATNLPDGTVACFLSGAAKAIDAVLERLRAGEPINSWGAAVQGLDLVEAAEGRALDEHQVTTQNVDEFNWSSGVDMYL